MNYSMSEQKRLIPLKNLAWKKLMGQVVVLDPNSKKFHTLNEVASQMWTMLQSKDQSEVIQELLSEFEVPVPKLEQDIKDFIKSVIELKLMNWE